MYISNILILREGIIHCSVALLYKFHSFDYKDKEFLLLLFIVKAYTKCEIVLKPKISVIIAYLIAHDCYIYNNLTNRIGCRLHKLVRLTNSTLLY